MKVDAEIKESSKIMSLIPLVNEISKIKGQIEQLQEKETERRAALVQSIKAMRLKPGLVIEGEDVLATWQCKAKTSVNLSKLKMLVGLDKLMDLVAPNLGKVKKALKAEEFTLVSEVATDKEPSLTIRSKGKEE